MWYLMCFLFTTTISDTRTRAHTHTHTHIHAHIHTHTQIVDICCSVLQNVNESCLYMKTLHIERVRDSMVTPCGVRDSILYEDTACVAVKTWVSACIAVICVLSRDYYSFIGLFYRALLQKRPMFFGSLLIVATSYRCCGVLQYVRVGRVFHIHTYTHTRRLCPSDL